MLDAPADLARFDAFYKGLVGRYLNRTWSPSDGVDERRIAIAEARLGSSLPPALHALYKNIGAVPEFCTIHNQVLAPEELEFIEGYLLFMDDHQSVVSWGIRREQLREPDPEVWQRNNTPPEEWFSEERSLGELFVSMLDWYVEGLEILQPSKPG